MNFAVIKTGGKQYKVQVGDIIKVEKLPDQKTVEFRDLMAGKKVKASLISQGRFPKVRILKFHRRQRYRRNRGHRQSYSEIRIDSIQ